ncbi:hypothetical protein [Actinoplanes sp. TFC3]|uniref:hypothetical protein n=1 Tax=Actinoplanes sp. TFC3 TaxID=1710355 RepID=UPI000829503D|nr:hypothetical protein [Actinoplanes sp. TFC3]
MRLTAGLGTAAILAAGAACLLTALDPRARRHALAVATLEIIAEVGIGRSTHRAVAARAGADRRQVVSGSG